MAEAANVRVLERNKEKPLHTSGEPRHEKNVNPKDILSSEYIKKRNISLSEMRQKEDLLLVVNEFVEETGEEFTKDLDSLMQEYAETTRFKSSVKVVEKTRGTDLLKPRFDVYGKNESRKFLDDIGYPYVQVEDESVLVVFNLPKPLAQFWWKGVGEWGALDVDIDESAVEWGTMYRELMPVVWDNLDKYQYGRSLVFYRVNDVTDHEPGDYYYIWEVQLATEKSKYPPVRF